MFAEFIALQLYSERKTFVITGLEKSLLDWNGQHFVEDSKELIAWKESRLAAQNGSEMSPRSKKTLQKMSGCYQVCQSTRRCLTIQRSFGLA